MASYTFRWPCAAHEVFVTGTFDDWGKTVKLDRLGDGEFEKNVLLPEASDKLHYKFVVDGEWTTDNRAPEENDGSNNINNVLYPHQFLKDTVNDTTAPHPDVAAAMLTPDSPTAALGANVPKQAEQVSTLSSAAPESSTAELAKQVPLEKKGNLPGSFPETPSKEPEQFSVNPIPASEGASNPVKLKPGEKVPDPSTTHTNTVQSTVRTDPEGYEQDASASLAGLAGATNPASVSGPSSGRRQSKIIPESGLPVDGESVGLTDTGVTIESAAPASTTAGLAAGVPLESQKKQANGGGSAVNEVPDVVRNSISEAHRDPEAAANKEAVGEKKEFEDELQKKVKVDESAGTPGPTTSAALTETAPVAAGTTSHSTQLSPRSTPPPEPTVTTGVASSRTPEVSGHKGGASEGAAESKASEATARKTSDPEGHSGLTGPPQNKNGGASEPQAEPAQSKPAEASANGNGNGNETVRKDYAEKAKEQASDVAKEQKKKHRGSGFFQKLKEKLK